MEDYIVRATAAGGQMRAFAATTKNLVESARVHHNTSPVATAALGRTLTAGVSIYRMLTVDSLGKNLCHTCFTSSSCSTKKIGMSDTVGINLIL